MPEAITDNLDLWTSALLVKSTAGRGSNSKLEAYGIKKLRELILELAVRGKLVPQDPNDEPASVLFEKIVQEKARLAKEGEIKEPKDLSRDTQNISERHVPGGWKWSRLGELAYVQMGNSPPGSSYNDDGQGVPLINGPVEFSPGPFGLTKKIKFTTSPTYMCKEGDILVCVRGATTGRTNIASANSCIGRGVALVRAWEAQAYINLFMWHIGSRLLEAGKGTTFPSITYSDLAMWPLHVPPLVEQHRIVAKVDELMALCDQLEQQQTHSIEAHQALVASLLGTLTRVESQQEFSAAWARIASHFDTLFTTEASIDQLKQTILQLAVMGKLVPQDPDGEPASVLLEKIAREKARLIKEGVIKNEKSLPSISNEKIPFDVPNGWIWQRLGELGFTQTGGTPSKTNKEYFGNDIPFIKPGDIYPGYVDYDNEGLSNDGAKTLGRTAPAGSILMVCIGTIGKCNMIERTCAFNQQINSITPYLEMSAYLLNALSSGYFQKTAWERSSSTTIAILNKGKWVDIIVPIPPLEEQYRIVAKVDELMALCDTLKARLADAQAIQLHLADAIVERATN